METYRFNMVNSRGVAHQGVVVEFEVCEKSGRYVATSRDVDGLYIEEDTYEEMVDVALHIIPVFLVDYGKTANEVEVCFEPYEKEQYYAAISM